MSDEIPQPSPDEPTTSQTNPKRALLVLAFLLVLAAGGWWLVQKMSADSSVQDCVMAGRKNCAPLDPSP